MLQTQPPYILLITTDFPPALMAAIHYFRDYFINAVANLLQQRGDTIDLIHCHDTNTVNVVYDAG